MKAQTGFLINNVSQTGREQADSTNEANAKQDGNVGRWQFGVLVGGQGGARGEESGGCGNERSSESR